jgi:uncharacterized membrane protein
MKTRHWDALALGSIAAAAVASAGLYSRLPERVATHFDLHGDPNGWMTRPWAAAFMPVFALVLWALVRFAPRVLPRSDEKRIAPNVVAMIASVKCVFLAALHFVILRFAIAPGIDVTRAVFLLVGPFFVAIGLVLPRVKRNPIIGVRTAWTLRSDENWARSQRVGGYSMVTAGLVSMIGGGLGGTAGAIVALSGLIVAGIVPVVYSLVIARRLEPR